jgi:ubiquinone biosynthesis protein
MRLFRVAQRFNVEIQPQLILLHKTLFNIEGLGRELYPELDIFKTARPVLKQWMDEQVGARAMIDDLRENLPQLRHALRELPGVIRELSDRAKAGDLTLDLRSDEIERIRRELEGQRQQRYWLIVAMTSLLAGTLVLTLQGNLYIGGGLLVAGALGVFAGRPNA